MPAGMTRRKCLVSLSRSCSPPAVGFPAPLSCLLLIKPAPKGGIGRVWDSGGVGCSYMYVRFTSLYDFAPHAAPSLKQAAPEQLQHAFTVALLQHISHSDIHFLWHFFLFAVLVLHVVFIHHAFPVQSMTAQKQSAFSIKVFSVQQSVSRF